MNSLVTITSLFSHVGIFVAILALLVYDVFFLQRKLITLIENNTKAMTELKNVVLQSLKDIVLTALKK